MLQDKPNLSLKDAGDKVNQVADTGMESVQSLLDFQLLNVSGITVTVGGVLMAAVVLAGVWVVSALARRAITRYGSRHGDSNRAALYTLSRIVHYILLAIGLMVAMDLVGIPVSKFTIFAGALGVGLGFGLQAIFSNFISGLILLFDRSLKVGDFVELESGVHGEVRDIKIRATTIITNDNIDILVPNSEFVSGRVVNWTHREISRRMRIPFGVSYGSDKELVKKAALEAAAEVSFTLAQDGPRGPRVWLSEFGDSSLNFELVVWLTAAATKRPSAVKAAYMWALHTALEKYDIEIPFPQQDLHVRSLFGQEGDQALTLLRALGSKDARLAAEGLETRAGKQRQSDQLSDAERAELAANDAQQDAQQEIAESEAEAAARAEAAQAERNDEDAGGR